MQILIAAFQRKIKQHTLIRPCIPLRKLTCIVLQLQYSGRSSSTYFLHNIGLLLVVFVTLTSLHFHTINCFKVKLITIVHGILMYHGCRFADKNCSKGALSNRISIAVFLRPIVYHKMRQSLLLTLHGRLTET